MIIIPSSMFQSSRLLFGGSNSNLTYVFSCSVGPIKLLLVSSLFFKKQGITLFLQSPRGSRPDYLQLSNYLLFLFFRNWKELYGWWKNFRGTHRVSTYQDSPCSTNLSNYVDRPGHGRVGNYSRIRPTHLWIWSQQHNVLVAQSPRLTWWLFTP